MIKYALRCQSTNSDGSTCETHFDGWFKNADVCDVQLTEKRLACPSCKGTDVIKSLQSPHLANKAGKNRSTNAGQIAPKAMPKLEPKSVAPVAAVKPNAVMTPEAEEAYKNLYAMTKKLQDHVKSTCDDVGKDFAEAARKIHYGESPERGIYGQVTETDAKDLVEEGISIAPIPMLPKSDS